MKKPSALVLVMALLFSLPAFSVPKLNSFATATATIFLDFDGHYVQGTVWNGGNPINCAPANMTDAQITEAFYRVAEDYRPFFVNVTTDSTVFRNAPLNMRIRVIVTATNGWYPGVGGVAYVGSFSSGDDTPCFVFSEALGNSPKMVGECCSHESGHTIGLSHQSKYASDCTTPSEPYNSGSPTGGEIGWAPIMGNSYYRNMSNWNNGPTPYGCTANQDNLSIIVSGDNGFTYRPDDYPETLNASTYTVPVSSAFNVPGIITTNSDRDAFRFVLPTNRNFRLNAIPFNVGSNYIGANLDIKLELYNSAGTKIRTYDPPSTMSVTIDTVLNAGTYYIRIDGTGNANIGEYGSLGSYTLTGTAGALPIHDVSLNGRIENNKHSLGWSIIADEPIKTIVVEFSGDGTTFRSLTSTSPATSKFTYQPYTNGTVYYRLKVTSVLDQTVYSNIVALKATGSADRLFTVSTLIQNEIVINASAAYNYRLTDANGRVVTTGNGAKGINRVDIFNQPSGMYILQLFNNEQQQSERIIKQ